MTTADGTKLPADTQKPVPDDKDGLSPTVGPPVHVSGTQVQGGDGQPPKPRAGAGHGASGARPSGGAVRFRSGGRGAK